MKKQNLKKIDTNSKFILFSSTLQKWQTLKNIIFDSILLEISLLKEIRALYNPKILSQNPITKSQNTVKQELIHSFYYCLYSFIYYFFPLWIVAFPFRYFLNLTVLKRTSIKINLKISFSLENYKNWAKNSLMENFNYTINFQFVVGFFSIAFGILKMISVRYQDQKFSYFAQKNLPALFISPQKISLETFNSLMIKNRNTPLDSSVIEKADPACIEYNPIELLSKKTQNISFDSKENEQNNVVKPTNGSKSVSDVYLKNKADGSKKDKKPSTNFTEDKQVSLLSFRPSIFNFFSYIKRIDFYSNSILIEVNSNWEIDKNQSYLALYPKKIKTPKNYTSYWNHKNQYISQENNILLKSKNLQNNVFSSPSLKSHLILKNQTIKNLLKIGNNWFQVASKDLNCFFPSFENSEINRIRKFPILKNWISDQNNYKVLEPLVPKPFFVSSTEKPLISFSSFFLTIRNNLLKIKAGKMIQGYENKMNTNFLDSFYSNLDEFPTKLNEPFFENFVENNNQKIFLPVKNYSLVEKEQSIFFYRKGNKKKNFFLRSMNYTKNSLLAFKESKSTPLNFLVDSKFLKNESSDANQELLALNREKTSTKRILNNLENPENLKNFLHKNNFYLKRSLFYKKYNILQNEYRKFFNTLNPIQSFTTRESFSKSSEKEVLLVVKDFNFSEFCSQHVLKLLKDVVYSSNNSKTTLQDKKKPPFSVGINFSKKLKKWNFLTVLHKNEKTLPPILKKRNSHSIKASTEKNFLLPPRLMSGYKFPDMTVEEVRYLFLQFFYKKTLSDSFRALTENFFAQRSYFSKTFTTSRQQQDQISQIFFNSERLFSSPQKKNVILNYLPVKFLGTSSNFFNNILSPKNKRIQFFSAPIEIKVPQSFVPYFYYQCPSAPVPEVNLSYFPTVLKSFSEIKNDEAVFLQDFFSLISEYEPNILNKETFVKSNSIFDAQQLAKTSKVEDLKDLNLDPLFQASFKRFSGFFKKSGVFKNLSEIIYKGPGVVLNKSTNDGEFENKEKLQTWLNLYFSEDNPFLTDYNYFFGRDQISKTNLLNESFSSNEDLGTGSQQNEEKKKAKINFFSFNETGMNLIEKKVKQNQLLQILSQIGSTVYTLEENLEETNEEKNELANSVFSYDSSSEIPFTEKFRIPYLKEEDWNAILEKTLKKLKKDVVKVALKKPEEKQLEENEVELVVPLISFRIPKKKPVEWNLNGIDYKPLFSEKEMYLEWTKRNEESQLPRLGLWEQEVLSENLVTQSQLLPSHLLQDAVTQNKPVKNVLEKKFSNPIVIKFHYFPPTKSLLNHLLMEKKLIGGIYQKILSIYKSSNKSDFFKWIYKKDWNTKFHECWEPITFSSWLILVKVSYLFFVLHILRHLYKNYGKEIVQYIVSLLSKLEFLDEGLTDVLDLEDGEKGFRLFSKVQKRFRDIAGIDDILSELGEIVWFLRNSGRSFKVGNIVPKALLLVGPPGTGKTLLVQAIAGEAEVPVLVQSGGCFNDPEKEGLGAKRLKKLFQKARTMAPCIIFIDEIDTLGEKRENVIQNPMGSEVNEDLLTSLTQSGTNYSHSSSVNEILNFIPKPKFDKEFEQKLKLKEKNLEPSEQPFFDQNEGINLDESSSNYLNQENSDKKQIKEEKLNILMQFLVELDGLQARKGIIVIGATNRPSSLDLALTRPGRFDQIITLNLPGKEKRIEILKLYSHNLGIEKNISWDYLANRTIGFSAAELASIMNESSMKAILNESIHTIKTIEYGINSITSYTTEKIYSKNKKYTDPFFISRLAFYQAGKAVLHSILLDHPPVIVLSLWPRQKNPRQGFLSTLIQKEFLEIKRRSQLEARIIGLYAGKAAEFLILWNTTLISREKQSIGATQKKIQKKKSFLPILKKNSNKPWKRQIWESDLGKDELNFANFLAFSMVTKWFFYSKKILTRQLNTVFSNHNAQEIQQLDAFQLLKQISDDYENEINTACFNVESNESVKYFQKWSIRPWWQLQVIKQTGIADLTYESWYRIFLPDPEETERNEEWIPPDEYYHYNKSLKNLSLKPRTGSIDWNELAEIDRDYIYQGLVLNCFNSAFSILDENREILDYFSSALMRYELIRQNQITKIFSQFRTGKANQSKKEKAKLQNKRFLKFESIQSLVEQPDSQKNKIKFFEKYWGKKSRRQFSRFIEYDLVKETPIS
jgi:ATP-dependent Zn protease